MITIWKTPIVATVEQVLKDLKLQLYGAGLLNLNSYQRVQFKQVGGSYTERGEFDL